MMCMDRPRPVKDIRTMKGSGSCGRVSGLVLRLTRPPALMVFADRQTNGRSQFGSHHFIDLCRSRSDRFAITALVPSQASVSVGSACRKLSTPLSKLPAVVDRTRHV